MKSIIWKNFTWLSIAAIWIFALLNPVFKKYDYGAGYPMVILFAVVLGILAFRLRNTKREQSHIEEWSLIAFCIFVVISFLTSQMKTLGFSEVLAFLSMAAFYLLFALRKIDWSEKMLRVVMIGGMGSIVVGFLAYILWPEPRMMGPFFSLLYHAHHWPNAFALFLLMLWPIVLVSDLRKIFGKKYGGRLVIKATVLAFILSALLLTYSRGALIAFIGQMLLFGLFFWRKINWQLIIKASIVTVTSLVIFVAANMAREENHPVIDVEERVQFENEESLTSVQERKDFWMGSLKLIEEHPWYGTGPFSFRQAYYPLQKNFLAIADHPHNFFLKIGAENGLLALGAFLIFLLSFCGTIFSRWKNLKSKDKVIVSALLIAIAGALAHSLIDYNFNFFANFFLLFLLMTIARSLVIKKEDSPKRQWPALFIAFVIAIVAFLEGIILVGAEIGDDEELRFSFFPRAYFVTNAEEAIEEGNYERALALIDRQQLLSPLSDSAYYLRSKLYCNEDFEAYNLELCRNNIAMALGLNDMNDWNYYLQYLLAFGSDVSDEFIEDTLDKLDEYEVFVDHNVHFTAYTDNVEAAASVMLLIADHVDTNAAVELINRSEAMLERAEELREAKQY